VSLCCGGWLDESSDADLPSQALPMKEQGGFRISGELHALGAIAIGIKDEAALVGSLQENHPNIRQTAGVDRGDRHCLWIGRFTRLSLRKPSLEQRERFFSLSEILDMSGWLR